MEFWSAIERRDVEELKRLLALNSSRVNVGYEVNGELTPLHLVCQSLRLYDDSSFELFEMMRVLVGYGASFTIGDWQGIRPIDLISDFFIDDKTHPLHFQTYPVDHIDLVYALIRYSKDVLNDTQYGVKAVRSLVFDNECDPDEKGSNGRTLLHFACADGNIELVHILVSDCKADLTIRDDSDSTPFMTAGKNKKNELVKSLVCDYGCDPNAKGSKGRTLLHFACADGNIELVHILVQDCRADLTIRDDSDNTPLMMAAANNQLQSVLHLACANGNIDLVHVLVRDYKADLNIRDDSNNTPLLTAAKNDQYTVVKALIHDYGCDPKVEGFKDVDLLYFACSDGDINLMRVLADKHKDDLNIFRNSSYDTPLLIAAKYNQLKIVKSLILDYGCNPNVKDSNDKTPLYIACANGYSDLVYTLLKECKCHVNTTDKGGRSLLHMAGSVEVIHVLINQFHLSPSVTDNDGNTPLHLFSSNTICECVRVLLFDFHAPVYMRNKAGQTPRDISTSSEVDSLFTEYLSTHGNVIKADYKSMQLLAGKRYSGSNFICRLFVVGHPGAGKSSLVETLKREGFFESWFRVSEKSVPPHTAGIVPTVFMSKGYGRVQFYDFAGDAEYYSSHAAILERMFRSDIGTNICILVLNLLEENSEIEKKYLFWLSFIRYSFRGLEELPSIIVIGSHIDKLSQQDISLKIDHIKQLTSEGCVLHYQSLDCCNPRDNSVKLLRQRINKFATKSQPYSLTHEESTLLGLLEKDFSNVTACSAISVANLVKEVNLSLPRSVPLLYPILQQLQAIGVLLLVGDKGESSHVVLNVAQLTNEVHKKLFSKGAILGSRSLASFNIGLLPESLLQEVLPKYITKECLIQLQYCQEVSHIEISSDHSVSQSITSRDKSYLFFPALCSLEKNISWLKLSEHSYTIGWLARCSDPQDFLPPRFLHVLLLRIALRFTLVASFDAHEGSGDDQHLKRRCKMWKSGVHWLTEKGVECEVDVKESKEIVVSIQSKKNNRSCLTVFNGIINCVTEAKAEFCHSIKLCFFLLNALNSLSDDNLFPLEDVRKVLQCNDTTVVSVSGSQWMDRSKLVHIHSTFWESLFPIDEHSVLKYLENIVREWLELGLKLELPLPSLKAIETNHPRDVIRCKIEMVSLWLSSLLDSPPCWCSLVKALQDVGQSVCAANITKDKGEHITLQEKLLNSQEDGHLTPHEEFLESFSGVVGSKWPYLASLLSLTSSTIEEVRREGEGLTQRECALSMLHKWVSKGEATYDQLYQKLKPVSLFSYC